MTILSFSFVLVIDLTSITVDPAVIRVAAVVALLLLGVAMGAISRRQAIRALIRTYVGRIGADQRDQA